LFGFERIATAVDIAEANFGSGQAESAVLATAYNYPDALAGAALAAAKNGPVLLTGRESLDSQTAAALQRMLPPGGPVYLLGGSVALSDEVQASIQSLGYHAIRLAGRNRYETAVAVINAIGPITQVLLATGNDYEAALLGGAAAGHLEAGLLLTNGTITDAAADAYIASHPDLARTAVGTDAVHADPQAIPLPAADPYQLSVDVARAFYAGATTFAVASGRDYPDALAGGVDAARRGAPLLLTEAETLPQPVRTYLQQYGDAWTGGVVYGGSVAVGREVFRTLQAIAYKPGLS
jgi:putative cell wall-binding protein